MADLIANPHREKEILDALKSIESKITSPASLSVVSNARLTKEQNYALVEAMMEFIKVSDPQKLPQPLKESSPGVLYSDVVVTIDEPAAAVSTQVSAITSATTTTNAPENPRPSPTTTANSVLSQFFPMRFISALLGGNAKKIHPINDGNGDNTRR